MIIHNINSINNNKSSNINFKAKKITTEEALKLKKIILSEDTICLQAHKEIDDDAINSLKVIYNFRKRNGLNSWIYSKQSELNKLFFKGNKYKTTNEPITSVPNFLFDCNSNDRIYNPNKTNPILVIDHHLKTEKTYTSKTSYIDSTAKSCCAIMYRLFESLGEVNKLTVNDLRSLYCGILSDYEKFGLVKIENMKLTKLPTLSEDKNAQEVLEAIENKLCDKNKTKVYKHLDILSTLNKNEKKFVKNLGSNLKFTNNGKLAYIIIDANNKQWKALGMDNTRTSTILRDLRLRMLKNDENDALFTNAQKDSLKNIKGAIIFYRSEDLYKMSIHSKDCYAKNLINTARENFGNDIEAGGHSNRAGGRVNSLDQDKIKTFISNFLTAAEKTN